MSYSLVIFAFGALARSQFLKSFFLPGAGLVAEYVLSGSPFSWTITLDVSTVGPLAKESALAFGPVVAEPPPPPLPAPRTAIAAARMQRVPAVAIRRCDR